MMPTVPRSPGLLVSVRSPREAAAALQGGAHIVDVKEPMNGSLGRAEDATITAILDCVGNRCPVSAALGELADGSARFRDSRLSFVKWGLAGCRGDSWTKRLTRELAEPANPQTVVVAYADWQCAQAPALPEVVAFACQKPGNVLLIDTHCKEPGTLKMDRRPTLLDWVARNEIYALCAECRAAGVRVALAGSLGTWRNRGIARGAAPDWFAVRGAVCEDHDRQGTIAAAKVRRLVDYLNHV